MIPPIPTPDLHSRAMIPALLAYADALGEIKPEGPEIQFPPVWPGNEERVARKFNEPQLAIWLWTDDLETVVREYASCPPDAETLCAFGSVYDRTCNIDADQPAELRALLAWLSNQSAQFPSARRSDDPLQRIYHPDDILAALRAVLPGEGNKTAVEDTQLRLSLAHDSFPAGRGAVIGGAAAIISGVLNQLGVRSCFYAPYHSDKVAEVCCEEAQWLDLNHAEPLSARPARRSGAPNHPTRYGFALAYQPGDYTTLLNALTPLRAEKADRHLLVLRHPIGARAWETCEIDGEPGAKEPDANEWPMPGGFARWEIRGPKLAVWDAPDEWLRELGRRHAYVIVTLPQPKDLKNGALAARLRRQLGVLREEGATLHLEFSSTADPNDDLHAFAEFARGRLDSIGVNAEELPSYANLVDPVRWPRPAGGKPKAAEPGERYDQSLALAIKLGIQRLYAHGNDIDIILRRGATAADLEAERQGDLFAKGAVYVATTLRNGYTLAAVRAHMPENFGAGAIAALEALRKHLAANRQGGRFAGALSGDVFLAAAEPRDYGVVAVPCIWYDRDRTPRPFSSTGAGDITSGVSLVYSGFRRAPRGQPNAAH